MRAFAVGVEDVVEMDIEGVIFREETEHGVAGTFAIIKPVFVGVGGIELVAHIIEIAVERAPFDVHFHRLIVSHGALAVVGAHGVVDDHVGQILVAVDDVEPFVEVDAVAGVVEGHHRSAFAGAPCDAEFSPGCRLLVEHHVEHGAAVGDDARGVVEIAVSLHSRESCGASALRKGFGKHHAQLAGVGVVPFIAVVGIGFRPVARPDFGHHCAEPLGEGEHVRVFCQR